MILRVRSFILHVGLELYGLILSFDRLGMKSLSRYKPTEQNIDSILSDFYDSLWENKFWGKELRKYGLVRNTEDVGKELKKLPIYDKETIKKNAKLIHQKSIKSILRGDRISKTSGSTGSGLEFFTSRNFRRKQWSTWYDHWVAEGVPVNSYRLWLGGKNIFPKWYPKPFFVVRSTKTLYVNIYKYSAKNDRELIDMLNQYEIRWIHGYPSTVTEFVNNFSDKASLKSRIDFVTVSSENMTTEVAGWLEGQLQAKIVEHYGQSEGVANISRTRNRWKVDAELSLVEFVHEVDDLFKIVGTGYQNKSFPFVRYYTGDLAEVIDDKVKRIHGREDDFVLLASGRKLLRMDHLFKGIVRIEGSQILQRSLREIEIKYLGVTELSPSDKELIYGRLRGMTNELKIKSFLRVNSLIKTKSGKVKTVIRQLNVSTNTKSK